MNNEQIIPGRPPLMTYKADITPGSGLATEATLSAAEMHLGNIDTNLLTTSGNTADISNYVGSVANVWAMIVDEASATVTYQGWAAPGSSQANALWRIRKITVSGSVTTVTWADGDVAFDNIWNNRASLSYS